MKYKYIKLFLQIIFLIAISCFIYFKLHDSWSDVVLQLKLLTLKRQLLALFLIFIQVNLSFYAWYLIQNSVTLKNLNIGLFYSVFFTSNLAKYLPGGIWDHVGKYTLLSKQTSISKSEITKSIYIYILYSVLSASIFFIPLAIQHLSALSLLIFSSAFLLILIIILINLNQIKKLYAKYTVLHFIFSATNQKYLKPALILLISWIIYGVSLYSLIASESHNNFIQLMNTIMTGPTAWVAGYLFPFAPNGIGIRESTIYYFLSDGIAGSVILAALLVFRLLSIIIDIILGIASILILNIVYRNTEYRKFDS